MQDKIEMPYTKYRKKPVVIDAFQMTEERRWHNDEWPNWLHDAWTGSLRPNQSNGFLEIKTLEGWLNVSQGDWIIRGVKGELYPCKPDVFKATYEPLVHAHIEVSG